MAQESHNAGINRSNPTAMIFLVDQSGSMSQPFGRQPEKRKADGVAELLNKMLYDLGIQCTKNHGIHDYLYVAIIGYGAEVKSAFKGALADRGLVSVGELVNNPLRIEEGTRMEKDFAGRDVVKKTRAPIWIEPTAGGKTPLAEAFALATQLARDFVTPRQFSFPPLVINLTDGMPSTDPRPQAKALCDIGTNDGKVLLFNVHISEKAAAPIEFPDKEESLPAGDNFARFLFRISSVLPKKFVDMGRALNLPVREQSRGFMYNADVVALNKFLDMGTKTQQANMQTKN